MIDLHVHRGQMYMHKIDISTTNLSAVTDITVAKIEQIKLQNKEYLEYCPNYWGQYA